MFEALTPARTVTPPARRGLIFDLDGTLVDSLGDLHASLNRLLAGRALPPLTRDQVRAMVGDGVRMLVSRALHAVGAAPDDATLDRAVTDFLVDYEAAPAVHTRPYPGVPETLAALRDAGWAMAVCTNKPYAASIAILDALKLSAFFTAVIGGDSTPARKPDPRPLQAAIAALGIDAADAVMIGDGPHDALAAQAAGVRFIGVDYGYGHEELAALRPSARLLRCFAELGAAFV